MFYIYNILNELNIRNFILQLRLQPHGSTIDCLWFNAWLFDLQFLKKRNNMWYNKTSYNNSYHYFTKFLRQIAHRLNHLCKISIFYLSNAVFPILLYRKSVSDAVFCDFVTRETWREHPNLGDAQITGNDRELHNCISLNCARSLQN